MHSAIQDNVYIRIIVVTSSDQQFFYDKFINLQLIMIHKSMKKWDNKYSKKVLYMIA